MTFGGKKTSDTDGPAAIPRFLVGKSIKPFITNELTDLLGNPFEYRPVHGGRNAIGHEATLLPKICSAILEARYAKAIQAPIRLTNRTILGASQAQETAKGKPKGKGEGKGTIGDRIEVEDQEGITPKQTP